jgi:hypothetical protein
MRHPEIAHPEHPAFPLTAGCGLNCVIRYDLRPKTWLALGNALGFRCRVRVLAYGPYLTDIPGIGPGRAGELYRILEGVTTWLRN